MLCFNDLKRQVALKVNNEITLNAPPFYSRFLLEMQGDGPLEVIADTGERFLFDMKFGPLKRYKIFLVPTVHTDWGYTATQDEVMKIHKANTERGLAMSKQGIKWVSEVLEQLVDHKRDPEVKEQNAKGYFGIQGIPLNILIGLCSHEELVRMFYDTGKMIKDGYIIKTAALNDIPTAPWGIVSSLSDAGIRYYIQASNPDRGPLHVNGNIVSPFYWVGPNDKKVLAWFSGGYYGLLFGFNGYHQGFSAGLLSSAEDAAAGIALFVSEYEARGYPYEELMMYGVFVDNSLISDKYARTLEEFASKWENPQIQLSTPEEFFSAIETRHGDKLPEIKGDFGAYWEDGAASSSLEQAYSMEAKRLLSAYEAIHALDEEDDPFAESCWRDIMFWDEHTWGDSKSVSDPNCDAQRKQWAIKSEFAQRPLRLLREKLGTGYFFNPYPFYIKFYDQGTLYEVPPLSSVKASPSQLSKVNFDGKLENEYYRIEFQGGRVTGVFDKELQDYVFSSADSGYGFDECVYVKGGKGTTLERTITNYSDFGEVRRPIEGKDYIVYREVARVLSAEAGSDVEEVTLEALCGPVKVTKTIQLLHDKKEILVRNEVEKAEEYDKEALYFAFPSSLDRPEVYVEEPGAFTNVNRELAPGACAAWFATNGIVAIKGYQKARTIKQLVAAFVKSWDAPMITVGDINRGQWPSRVNGSGLLFSYAMNNYWHTNYKASQGGASFSYSITTGNASNSMFSDASKLMLKAVSVGSAINGPPIEVSGDAITTVIKKWTGRKGVLIRLLEVNNKTADVEITAKGRWKFYETDQLEETRRELGEGNRVIVHMEPRSYKAIGMEQAT
ncbi:hypothetical protein PQ610_07055 [Tardisphaera miroshnichenkoae]